MNYAQAMLSTHPMPGLADMSELTDCIEACFACAQACTACADACLGEPHVNELVHCIRTNLDCADVCEATGRLLSRQTQPAQELLIAQLQACAIACRTCGDVCAQHASMHEHCRVCAEACRECEEACNQMLEAMPMAQNR
jgi:hypothetical protein